MDNLRDAANHAIFVVAFSVRTDALIRLGAALIVASGHFTLSREAKQRAAT